LKRKQGIGNRGGEGTGEEREEREERTGNWEEREY